MYNFFKKLLFLWILFFSTSLFADNVFQRNVTISDASSVHEYDSYLQFAITIESSPPSMMGDFKVHYKTVNNGSATSGSDYTYTEGDVTFSSGGATTKVIKVPVLNDTIHESTEHVSVEITENSMLYEVTDGRGEGIIYDDDLAPLKLTNFYDKGVTETDSTQTLYMVAYFNRNLTSDVTVTYHTVDNTAHAGSDYVAVSGDTVIAKAGNHRVLLPINIKGDTSPESTEDFKVIIDSISNGTISDNQAIATIHDDDAIKVDVSCSDGDIEEGNEGESNNIVCHIFLAKPYPSGEPDLVIDYNSEDGGSPSATEGDDYTSVSGSVTFKTGDKDKIVTIPTIGDNIVEDDENVKLVISGSSYIIDSQSEGEILNDDGNFPSVDFSTANVSVVEGNSSTKTLNFHCELDADAVTDSYFDYYTKDRTAKVRDNDYIAISTTRYNIPEGTRDINIQVTVNGDTKIEKDEQFYLKVKHEHHIVVHGHTAKGTIINDDGTLATLKFDKSSYDTVEGNSSTKTLNFTLSLDSPALAGSSFDYYSNDDSAKVSDNDYVKVEDSKHIFSGGETNVTIPVTINGDRNIEDDEKFYLHICNETNLTISGRQTAMGKIVNDDGTYPKLDIENPSYSTYEGNSSTHTIDIKLVLDKPALENTSLDYYTYDKTAQDGSSPTEDNDYVATNGTLNIPKDSTSATLQVTINGDTNIEPNELFIIALKNPKNITFGRSSSGIYILNDDVHNEEPFTCDEHMYLSSSKKRGSEETGKMWLHRIDTSTSPFRFEVMDDTGEDDLYNAIGYNPEDNYIYGLYYRNLIKISKTGKIIDLGKVNALPATFDDYQLFAGAVYDNEHYYVAGMGIDTNTMYIINLNDKSVTEKTLSESINIKDFSLSPNGHLLYGIIDGGQFVKIKIKTGVVTRVGEAHSGEFDSTFSDKNGRFFANDSQGSGFYEFNTHSGKKSFLSDSQPATFNDGTNCLNAELLFTDYGDAPISYGPAWHNIANRIYLGDKVDHDIDSYDTVNADGDDLNGVDDDDGVTLVDGTDINGTYFETNATHQIKVKLSKEAYLKIWIDKGIDGHFDDSTDLIYSSSSKLSRGKHTITFSLGDGLTTDIITYLRARVSSSPSINPTGFMTDGEVEDYAIYFGTGFTPLHGKFNIERTNSGSYTINSNERNAWYTQIAGRDFDYSLVFYKEDFSAEQNISKIPAKIELFDIMNNKTLYERYIYISDSNSNSRFDFLSSGVNKKSPTNDLGELPASKEVIFRVTYPKNSSGEVMQSDCHVTAKECFEAQTSLVTDDAKDKFAIRPEKFYITVADGDIVRKENNNTLPNPLNLGAGYDYNLTVTASVYNNSTIASQGYSKNLDGLLEFNTTGTCADSSDRNISMPFSNGKFNSLTFNNDNVGEYILKVLDSEWTEVDNNKTTPDCVLNSDISGSDFNALVGCNIPSISDVNLRFNPYRFDVNFALNNLPANTHPDFLYMSELNATENNLSLQFVGTITAQNEKNGTTSNFTAGCMAKNLVLLPNATVESEDGILGDVGGPIHIKTAPQINGVRANVDIARMVEFNGDVNDTIFSILNDIASPINIVKEKFLDENNGSLHIDLRHNIQKNLTLPINPVQVVLEGLNVDSPQSWSMANNQAMFVPTGVKDLNHTIRNFYFAQVAPDLVLYPRVNFAKVKFVRTPLNVDIYCNTLNAYCTKTNIFNNTRIESSPRKQQGWYLSINHDGVNDGKVTALTATSNSVNITPATPITFTHGRNGMVITTFNNCNIPKVNVTIKSTAGLSYNPQASLPYYTIECTQNNSSDWTGIGKMGNTLEIKPDVNQRGRVDW